MMEIIIVATGGAASGKTYMLMRMKEFLEDKDFNVQFSSKEYDARAPHKHMMTATRSDDWVMENVVKK